ncbi:hypothetical protein EVAR_32562_1 [Eumeta japonica]|uniref:Uncharacterized protein n=1 Tax=Eumeta variegata TaxID=151549 RepID=A0A4C1VSC8_EUMVA|nr:hypothetical protein EVAR_32562_1 [Eumeta japonica]
MSVVADAEETSAPAAKCGLRKINYKKIEGDKQTDRHENDPQICTLYSVKTQFRFDLYVTDLRTLRFSKPSTATLWRESGVSCFCFFKNQKKTLSLQATELRPSELQRTVKRVSIYGEPPASGAFDVGADTTTRDRYGFLNDTCLAAGRRAACAASSPRETHRRVEELHSQISALRDD